VTLERFTHQELEIELAKAVQLNERRKKCRMPKTTLIGLQKAQLMKQRTGEVLGLITGVQSYGFFVEIEVPVANGI